MTHLNGPTTIQSSEQLEDLLSEPTEAVVEMLRRVEGDIILLGAGGKIGPSLARMAKRSSDLAGTKRRIIGVSRFSAAKDMEKFHAHGIETVRCDLLDETSIAQLPSAPNVIYLAGLKFGSSGNEAATWAMNTWLPGLICRKFRWSRIVAFSTGAIYGLSAVSANGSLETDAPSPIGEYAMSCLGRERMFEYFSRAWNIPLALIRLFYACEVRYGVLVDLARMLLAGEPIDVGMGWFNIIWQGDNNAMALLALEHTATPPFLLNVTGPEILSVRETAQTMGRLLGVEPKFTGMEAATTCLGNAGRSHRLFGTPHVAADRLIEWAVDWVKRDGEYFGKPTHFEVRDGKY